MIQLAAHWFIGFASTFAKLSDRYVCVDALFSAPASVQNQVSQSDAKAIGKA
jgi:hypothetical protein